MNQIADILKLAREAQQQKVDAVLATVVRTEGSAYRRAGAMMLICADGRSVGMISGGCLEPHIIKRAFWLTRNGANVQAYQTGDEQRGDDGDATDGLEIDADDELNFGLGCNGKVHVLFERLTSAQPLLDLITQVRQNGQPVTIATLIKSKSSSSQNSLSVGIRIHLDKCKKSEQVKFIGSQQQASNPRTLIDTVKKLSHYKFTKRNTDYVILNSDCLESSYLESNYLENNCRNIDSQKEILSEWLLQRIEPQKRLLICGAGNDVMPLVTMAKLQDWHVTVIDSRAQYATRARFAQADEVKCLPLDDSKTLSELSTGAAVALMSHSLSQDRARLSVLLANPNFSYLGQLGPRYRTERLIEEISSSHSDPSRLVAGIKKLHYPIGLKLGGDGPEALALSIMAQISAVMNNQAQPVSSIDKMDNSQLADEKFFTNYGVKNYAYD